jgi:hypothetical protein
MHYRPWENSFKIRKNTVWNAIIQRKKYEKCKKKMYIKVSKLNSLFIIQIYLYKENYNLQQTNMTFLQIRILFNNNNYCYHSVGSCRSPAKF